MDKQDKELLLKDLSARLPYEVKLLYNSNSIANIKDRVEILRGIVVGYTILFETDYIHSEYESTSGSYEHFKPYLRPMSSMTEEEDKEWQLYKSRIAESCDELLEKRIAELHDWFCKKHLDFRGLIPMDLALPAPEGMYNF